MMYLINSMYVFLKMVVIFLVYIGAVQDRLAYCIILV